MSYITNSINNKFKVQSFGAIISFYLELFTFPDKSKVRDIINLMTKELDNLEKKNNRRKRVRLE